MLDCLEKWVSLESRLVWEDYVSPAVGSKTVGKHVVNTSLLI